MTRTPRRILMVALTVLLPLTLAAQVPLTGQVVAMPLGKPLPGVEVRVKSLGRSVVTDSNGIFLMDSVPRGRYVVEAQKLGYRLFSSNFTVASMSDPEYRIELTTAPLMVASVVTTADAVSARLLGFEERRLRKGGGGRFLSAKDFAEQVGRPAADIFARIPGITIIRGTSGAAYLGSNRGPETLRENLLPKTGPEARARGAANNTCYAAVILNGVVMYDGLNQNIFDVNSIPVQSIVGVEYYSGGGSIPVQWSGLTPTCGLLAIWTKDY
jgi:hypothetical protein